MKRSDTKILTTHVGSLPFPTPNSGLAVGDATHLADDVAAVVAQQRAVGIDIINEGEYAKGGDWLRYMQNRFGGFTDIDEPAGKPLIEQGKDREEFGEFYRYASERGTLFYTPGAQIAKKRPVQVCTGPVTYTGQAELKQEIDVTIAAAGTDDVFLTSTAPASLEVYRHNRFYKSDEDYVYALAEAMRAEYEAIVAAGLILQVDDAWLPALWDRIGIGMGLAAFRARCEMRIEALNHALRNVAGRSRALSSVLGQLARPARLRSRTGKNRRSDAEGEGAGLSDRSRQRASRARSRGLGQGQTAARKNSHSRRRHPFDRRGRASGACLTAAAALRAARRQGEHHRRHRLRLRRPLTSADRVGQIAFAGRRRGAGEQGAGICSNNAARWPGSVSCA